MENVGVLQPHVERMMLVCGAQNDGKTWLLQNMLSDRRLAGIVRRRNTTPISLSKERGLVVRSASPHERGLSTTSFHDEIRRALQDGKKHGCRRMNFAYAVQPRPTKRREGKLDKIQGIVSVCSDLIKAFAPERIRVVQLSPNQFGSSGNCLTVFEVDGLRNLDVEVIAIDARRGGNPIEAGNVRVLADYFDFS
ncbi:hypothetical protein [Novosphingobium sp.]|uniref:hypothetical protein n=1 Tax=Novosphingobium sp. TaxID=1874826 RepID=UPI00273260D9|nr:hypothetical protein [Novosphingobium sp.]MDP3905842.1 hypothetical protein [Novosphingobium sp.]